MKKYLSLAALAGFLVAGMHTANAQLTWENIADATSFATVLPAGAQMGGTAVLTVGSTDFLYLVGPNSGGDKQNIYFVDVTDVNAPGAWQTATWVAPQNNLVYTTNNVHGYNGRLYVVAGDWNTSGSPEYNGIRVFAPAANGDITAIQQEYDGTQGNPDIVGFATTSTINPATGVMYIIASEGASSNVVQRVQIDGTTGNITGAPVVAGTLPVPLRQAPMVVHNGYLYVISGWNSVAAAASAAIYFAEIQGDGNLGTFFSTTASLPVAIFDGGAAVVNNKLYVIGGTTANNNPAAVNTVYYADLSSSSDITSWTTDNPIAFSGDGIRRIDAAKRGNNIFVVGGRQADESVNTAVKVGKDASSTSDWDLFN